MPYVDLKEAIWWQQHYEIHISYFIYVTIHIASPLISFSGHIVIESYFEEESDPA